MLQVMGPIARISDPQWAPFAGALEYYYRNAILMLHPGGTVEIQKTRVFRGLVAT